MVLVSVNVREKKEERKKRKEKSVHLVTSPPPRRIASVQSLPVSHTAEEGQPIEVSWGVLLERIPARHKAGRGFTPQDQGLSRLT